MDDRSGKIYTEKELENLLGKDFKKSLEFKSHFIPVKEDEMTAKQKKNKQVALQDNRSYLGRKRIQARKRHHIGRNDMCPCGSGMKYKKCCLNKKRR